ncbi:thioredoxin-like domain-containing protein, partial [Bacteroidota bacterium]
YQDTVCYLVHYYGNTNQIVDTAKVTNGHFVFEGNKELGGGIYIVVGEKRNMVFEFIINEIKQFSISTNASNIIGNISFKGSPENTIFYEYRKYADKKEKIVAKLLERKETYKNNIDSVNSIQKAIELINQDVIAFKDEFIIKYPDKFICKVFKASKDPEVPNPPVLPNGRIDSAFQYYYYKNHFWDNIDLTDDRLLRTPVYHGKLKQYFEKVLVQHPDTIILEVDKIIGKTRSNKEMFKFAVWYLTNTYERSKLMGFDAVFVHLVEEYYMTNQAYWVTPSVLQNITKRAMTLKPLLLGEVAPNLIMLDTNNRLVSLHNIDANYIVVYFWDPDCGHCKKETPKLIKFYNESKETLGVKVYAVSTDSDLNRWKKYIRDNGLNWINVNDKNNQTNFRMVYDITATPVIYLLDKDKKIIAKKLFVEPMQEYLKHYLEK